MTAANAQEAFGPIDPDSGKKEFSAGEVVPITEEEIKRTRELHRGYRERTKVVATTQGSSALTLSDVHNPAWS